LDGRVKFTLPLFLKRQVIGIPALKLCLIEKNYLPLPIFFNTASKSQNGK
jgi:hypothetical protein